MLILTLSTGDKFISKLLKTLINCPTGSKRWKEEE